MTQKEINLFRGHRESSRINWGKYGDSITLAEINTGALLRIADATEQMARSYAELLSQRDCLEREVSRLRMKCARLERSNAGFRDHLNHLNLAKKGKEK